MEKSGTEKIVPSVPQSMRPKVQGDRKALGEALSTASGGNFGRAEVNRNKRAPQWGVEPNEVADRSCSRKISFLCTSGMLSIVLPSGRRLSYIQPRIDPNQFGGESVTYMGTDSIHHWTRIERLSGENREIVMKMAEKLAQLEAAESAKRLDRRTIE